MTYDLRRLAAAGALLAAVLLLGAFRFPASLPDAPLLQTAASSSETADAFDPLSPLVEESDSGGADSDPMADMRLVRQILEIIGDTTDFSQLSSEQAQALADLGVDAQTLADNAQWLQSLIREDTAGPPEEESLSRQGTLAAALLILLAALALWLLHRRSS